MITKESKVSIIIPVYNTEKYLPECLNSCINQTLLDIEIICVNDGSTDDSERIIRSFQNIDPRIKLISQPNAGLPAARNAGIKAASGQTLMFLDSDDTFSEKACERVWLERVETGADIIIFGARCFPWYPEPDEWLKRALWIETELFKECDAYLLFNKNGVKPYVWRQAYSHKFLDRHHLLFDEDARFGEDLVFQMEVFPLGNIFSFIQDQLYNYRWIRPGSLMAEAEKDMTGKIGKHIDNVDRICAFWESHNLYSQYGQPFAQWIMQFIVQYTLEQDPVHTKLHFTRLKEIIARYDLQPWMEKLDYYHSEIYKKYLQELMEAE